MNPLPEQSSITDTDERKTAEAMAGNRERELKHIVDSIPALVWSARPDGSAEFFNQHYLDYVGLSANQVSDWGWTTTVHHEDRAQLAIDWQRIMASQEMGEAEARLRRHDGTYRWFLLRANPVHDEHGAIVKWYGINIDIEERKLALERLTSDQELLDLAQRSAGAMAFDWYVQKEINYWSPEQEALFGLAPGTWDGTYKSWKKMMYAPDWPNVIGAIEHAHETGEVTAEYRVVWPDGSLHWLSTNGRMFFDEAGSPVRMVGFTADVTRRKSVEEELRRTAVFLSQAQQLSSTGSFWWRVSTTGELMWSEELYRIFQLDRKAPITMERVRTRVHPDDHVTFDQLVLDAQEKSEGFDDHFRLLMPDSSVKFVHVVAQSYRDQNGDLDYIGAVQDVSDRRLSEEALDKARTELANMAKVMSLSALTASIAHEVNQPLAGIITNANTCMRMLNAAPPNVDGARETARRTIRDGHRAADVITRLRALFSKREATIEAVDLNDATREVLELMRTELQRNRVNVRTELPDDVPPVRGDRVQLQQVIMNLVSNASDAMLANDDRIKELTITVAPDTAEMVKVSVKDTGEGFEQGDVSKLFEAFYTTKSEGMGMGLSLSRSIVERHEGRIWATTNQDLGVTFSFTIPCVVSSNNTNGGPGQS